MSHQMNFHVCQNQVHLLVTQWKEDFLQLKSSVGVVDEVW